MAPASLYPWALSPPAFLSTVGRSVPSSVSAGRVRSSTLTSLSRRLGGLPAVSVHSYVTVYVPSLVWSTSEATVAAGLSGSKSSSHTAPGSSNGIPASQCSTASPSLTSGLGTMAGASVSLTTLTVLLAELGFPLESSHLYVTVWFATASVGTDSGSAAACTSPASKSSRHMAPGSSYSEPTSILRGLSPMSRTFGPSLSTTAASRTYGSARLPLLSTQLSVTL